MIVPHCQSFPHIWAAMGINIYNFLGFVSEFSESPATFLTGTKTPSLRINAGRG